MNKEFKKNSTAKFDESKDINFQLNLKKKKEAMNIRNVLNLPSGTGKKICENQNR